MAAHARGSALKIMENFRRPRHYPFMKNLALLALAAASLLAAQTTTKPPVHVDGYHTAKGATVAPYVRTAPDKTPQNNWSVKPNVNPETGKKGDKAPAKK
jgi:hypothetical protein